MSNPTHKTANNVKVAVQQEPAAWEAGYEAGKAGQPSTPPQGANGLSWIAGYIEGQAVRQSSRS